MPGKYRQGGRAGRKENFSDDSLRPALNYEEYKDAKDTNACTKLIAALGKIRQNTPALCYGDYSELELQTTHFAYARTLDGKAVITTVNNADNDVTMNLSCGACTEYIGALTGERVIATDGRIQVRVSANSGEIWIPAEVLTDSPAPIKSVIIEKVAEPVKTEAPKNEAVKVEEPKSEVMDKLQKPEEAEEMLPEETKIDWSKSYEEMSVEELQEAILEKMRRNGPVTDYMLGTVKENTHHGSLVNWVKSFQ